MRLTLKSINEELAKRGYLARLAKGNGYFYFHFGEVADWLDRTVRVPTVSSREEVTPELLRILEDTVDRAAQLDAEGDYIAHLYGGGRDQVKQYRGAVIHHDNHVLDHYLRATGSVASDRTAIEDKHWRQSIAFPEPGGTASEISKARIAHLKETKSVQGLMKWTFATLPPVSSHSQPLDASKTPGTRCAPCRSTAWIRSAGS